MTTVPRDNSAVVRRDDSMAVPREPSSAAPRETTTAMLALRLLSGQEAATGTVDWDELLRVAWRNSVLLRLSSRLRALGVEAPASFAEAEAGERRRARLMFDTIRRVGLACEEQGVGHIFAKSFQYYPDMGRDIDLFVAPRSAGVDASILRGVPAAPVRRDLRGRMSGVAAYRVAGGSVLEIHHGRLGVLGEHAEIVGQIIRNGARAEVGGCRFLLPAAEDLLVLHGMQRVYRHGVIRLCDLLSTASLVGREGLDWGYVLRTSEQLGTLYGLRSYLTYAGQIYREALGVELLPAGLGAELGVAGCGRAELAGGVFVFPRARVAGRVYLGKLRAAVCAGNWRGLSRLSLMPLVAAASLARALKPRVRAARAAKLAEAEG
jgi:Uncharacterised nucleotidyltransferase